MTPRIALAAVFAVAALRLEAQAIVSRVDETTQPLRLEPLVGNNGQFSARALGDPVDIPPRLFSLNVFHVTGTPWLGQAKPAQLRYPALGWSVDPLLHDTSQRLVNTLQQTQMTDGRSAWDAMARTAPTWNPPPSSMPAAPRPPQPSGAP